MAEIYLAVTRDTDPPRQFAIKVIHQQNAEDPDFVRMLIDEARLAVQLKHPNIVATFDLGQEGHQYYLAMEFVDGADLYKIEQRAADQRLSFPIPLCAYIAREVARGLDYAHRLKDSDGQPMRIVHRDVSPQNVLLSLNGDVKLTDFGIAKAARRVEQTQAGVIKGKYYYMSPEQASGQPIDGRTDIFATGILLYEMLVGEMLYYDENVEKVLQAARKADIPPVSKRRPDTPPDLERVVMRALRRRPEERYASASDLAQALEDFLRAHAPVFGPAEVGGFVARLTGARGRPRSSAEQTAAMPVQEVWVDNATPSPTMGLPADALDDLGIRDDNSLIFRRDPGLGRRPAGRRDGSSKPPRGESARRSAPPRGDLVRSAAERADRRRAQSETIGSASGSAGEPADKLPAGFRSVRRADKRPAVSPAEPRAETSQRLQRDRHALTPKEGYRREAPSGSTPSGPTGDWADQLKVMGKAAIAAPPRPTGVYPALDADREADVLLALAGEMRPQPVSLPRIGLPAQPGPGLHPALASQRSLSESYNDEGDTAVRPSPLADLIKASRPTDSSSEVPALELQQNDEAFTEPPLVPVEPKVELTQVDAPASSMPLASAASPEPAIPQESSSAPMVIGGSLDELDPISAETTQERLEAPPSRPPSRPGIGSRPELPQDRTQPSRRRWLYMLSGIGGAVFSALISLYFMDHSGRGRPAGAVADLGPAVDPDAAGPSVADTSPRPTTTVDLGSTPVAVVLFDAGTPRTAAHPSAAQDLGEPAATGTGRVQLSSKPEGAEVYFEKRLLGTTPLLLRDLPTDHDIKLELKLPGWKATRKRIHWRGKDFIEATVRMRSKESDGGDSDSETEAPEPASN
jgi:serine/threonine-protein kinase